MKGTKALFLSVMGALTLGSAIASGAFYERNAYCEIADIEHYGREDELVAYKPVIYLYPEKTAQASVTVEPNGGLTCVYPEYSGGWNVAAAPDGTLTAADGREFGCLFWEGRVNMTPDFSEGFCVKGEDTAQFLEWALTEQGLTPRERSEFIIYWLPQMQENPYNVIAFQGEAYESAAPLAVSPAPDSIKRVFMTYYSAQSPVDIPAQELTGFDRTGFAVLEWGGTRVEQGEQH